MSGTTFEEQRKEEDTLLSELKTEVVVRSQSYREAEGGDIPKLSAPALAHGAFGEYASALAQERDEDARALMKDAPLQEALPTTEAIAEKLHEQAAARVAQQFAEHEGIVERGSSASKLQSASDQFDMMMEKDKE